VQRIVAVRALGDDAQLTRYPLESQAP